MQPHFGGFFAMAMHRAMAHPMWGGFWGAMVMAIRRRRQPPKSGCIKQGL